MKFSDDESMAFQMNKVPEAVQKILMVLECPGLENLKDKPEALGMARFQLNDFEYDYPLSLEYFGENLKMEDLVLPAGEDGVIE